MEWFIGAVVSVAIGLLLTKKQRGDLRIEAHAAASHLGLEPVGGSYKEFRGDLDGVPVNLTIAAHDAGTLHIEVGEFPSGIQMLCGPDYLSRPFAIADSEFTARCKVQGPPTEVMALLDQRFRKAVCARQSVLEFRISGGSMKSEYSGVGRSDLESWIVAMGRLTRHMDPVSPRVPEANRRRRLEQKLIAMATNDYLPRMRIQAGRILLETDPSQGSAETAEFLWRTAPDVETRLRAAQHTDIADLDVLVEHAADGAFAASIRILAVKALARRMRPGDAAQTVAELGPDRERRPRIGQTLLRMVGRTSGDLLATVLDALTAGGSSVPLATLQRRFQAVGQAGRVALIKAATAHGLAGGQWALKVCQALPHPTIAEACCGVLWEHATLDQVEPLQKLLKRYGVRNPTRARLSAIIERLQAQAPDIHGGLALADPSGELALAKTGPGELGLATQD